MLTTQGRGLAAKFIDYPITYDGSQLRSHWIYDSCEILGPALVAFIGPCHVQTSAMVDKMDARKNLHIFSESMLHFIGEIFDLDLTKMILWQRLLVSLIGCEIERQTGKTILRSGNDLFDGPHKLSVAIATLSPVSSLLHVGINIISRNTPVPTQGVADYKIDPVPFANIILEQLRSEWTGVKIARVKVRGVS